RGRLCAMKSRPAFVLSHARARRRTVRVEPCDLEKVCSRMADEGPSLRGRRELLGLRLARRGGSGELDARGEVAEDQDVVEGADPAVGNGDVDAALDEGGVGLPDEQRVELATR